MKRKGKISRKTKETSISVDLNIDGNNTEPGLELSKLVSIYKL